MRSGSSQCASCSCGLQTCTLLGTPSRRRRALGVSTMSPRAGRIFGDPSGLPGTPRSPEKRLQSAAWLGKGCAVAGLGNCGFTLSHPVSPTTPRPGFPRDSAGRSHPFRAMTRRPAPPTDRRLRRAGPAARHLARPSGPRARGSGGVSMSTLAPGAMEPSEVPLR